MIVIIITFAINQFIRLHIQYKYVTILMVFYLHLYQIVNIKNILINMISFKHNISIVI